MLEFIINILSTPAILVGLMSLLGLALQRKPIEDIVKGTVKNNRRLPRIICRCFIPAVRIIERVR